MDKKDKLIQDLITMNRKLMEKIVFLEARVAELEKRLAKFENPKNSRNSSVPPSKDENRPKKTQSLREDSGKKSGGQPGHKGSTLEMNASPDSVIEHIPGFCRCCGKDLSGIPAELSSTRQVVDIPVIRPVYTAHKSFCKICPCGEKNKAAFPQHINAPVQYGHGVETMVSYLHARQYLPYKRMKELFKDCFGIGLSEGSIDNIIQRFAQKAAPVYQKLKRAVSDSAVIGCDETGAKVDGNKNWIWAYQTDKFTVLAVSESRGLKAIKKHFQEGFGEAILCHDAWRTYFNYSDNLHQLCCAHMLRELNYIVERYQSTWAEELRALFRDAISLKRNLTDFPSEQAKENIAAIESQLDKLLEATLEPTYKEAVTFQKRLLKYRDSILTFLHHQKVPPDNNSSERAVRNIKVKQKISGQFKSQRGAEDFCVIRSVVDTLIKQAQNVLKNLSHISQLVPE